MESNLKKYSIVYLTINTKNNKIYIGIHDTTNPLKFCGYLGCGVNRNYPSTIKHPNTPFMHAVKKYGFDSFIRVTLKVFDNREDAKKLESYLVDQYFIDRDDTYNIALGGGDPPRHDRVIYQYDLQGNFLRCYPNVHLAGVASGGTGGSSIHIAADNKCCAFESFWSFDFTYKLDISQYRNTIQKIPVYLYNLDGILVKELKSQSDAARFLNTTLGVVQRAITTQTKVKGYFISNKKIDKFTKEKKLKEIRTIYQYDLNGNFLNEYPSCNSIASKYGKQYLRVLQVLKMGNKKCGDFLWSFNKMSNIKSYVKTSKKVACYDKDGNLIKIYDKVRDARKDFANVSRVLSGKASHCKGYIFKYI